MITYLAIKLIPLYLNIVLGYIAGKLLDISRDAIARLMFFMINPLIIFNGVATTQIDASILSLPLLTFSLASLICISFYRLSRLVWTDSLKNLTAFTAGSGNTGYFGLSMALLLFNDRTEGVYIMAILGITLYENTIGYYMTAKESLSPVQCMKKIVTLPTTYAFILGLLVNVWQIPLPEIYTDFISQIKGVYTVMGMMIVGLGLASLTSFRLDGKFIGLTFFAKFLVWPTLVLMIVSADAAFFGFYDQSIHKALILLSIVPMAVNTVIMASLMKCYPEKAAAAVLLSTLIALFYVPMMTAVFIK